MTRSFLVSRTAVCLQWMLSLLLVAMAPMASAQTSPTTWAKGSSLALEATGTGGRPFDLSQLRGQVAVVFVWSTGCAVCRDSLPELRANAAGWQNKPFTLLAVNADTLADDWASYESLVSKTQAPLRNWVSVRLRGPLAAGQRLPLTLLVDARGKILQRFEGRLAPEVWDSVADLLP